ncbi:MAG TPA: hypothetical protein VFB36_08390 [Nevskiaceae bacterium]|nr:hypothetical protein [Nevskiaceae bacterium]
MKRSQVVLWIVLAALFAAFVFWYGGHAKPMTQAESDAIFAKIAEHAKNEPNTDPHIRDELHELAAQDDGNEYFMVNLIKYRAKALYPDTYTGPRADDPLEADALYNRAIAPYLFKHGNVPVFLGKPQGRFIGEAGDEQWDRVAIVRYRSRRDMLEMVADLAGQGVAVHKWASIEKTQVFPTATIFSLVFVRGLVAAILVLIGLIVHIALKGGPREP